MANYAGPSSPISKEVMQRYLAEGENFNDYVNRFCNTLALDETQRKALQPIIGEDRFLPAGRIQRGVGSLDVVTLYNCFVSGTIPDDLRGIFDKVTEAALTQKMGGGIGYDFSPIRPDTARITTVGANASGPVSFMHPFDAMCSTIMSAGNRRGAQMGTLSISHPNIEQFILAKSRQGVLSNFNISVLVTDEFMHALLGGDPWPLQFEGTIYKWVDPKILWETIMRNNYDWAEPGVIFISRVNEKNNLRYCEDIRATNPCGEQPLPPYGACLLGSFNMTKYVPESRDPKDFKFDLLDNDIENIVPAMDKVVDVSKYPLEKQHTEAVNKRRMGLGVTGMANALETMGMPYGSADYIKFQEEILSSIAEASYYRSAELADQQGAFPMYDHDKFWEEGTFASTLPRYVRQRAEKSGMRNSHLTSIAPTGTISLRADNISSGIEPPFEHFFERRILGERGQSTKEIVEDWAAARGVLGRTSETVTPQQHVNVLCSAQRHVDSAVSKTCNLPENISWEDFNNVYIEAWIGGAKGCTTYRKNCSLGAVLTSITQEPSPEETVEGAACFIDPTTGIKTCEE